MPSNKVHKNIPQLLYYLVQAQISVLIWGRATGKSSGPLADFSLNNWLKMPRSNGAFYCNTYTDLLTKVLPGVLEGWERMGYKDEKHFFITKYAPARYKWKRAMRAPVDPRHYIHCYNGAGIFLVSGDRSTSNGFNLDWAGIDEARLQRRDRLNQFILTIRGNAHHFGHLSNHHSVLFLSDMPHTSREKWILDYKPQMDEKAIELILSMQIEIYREMEKESPDQDKVRELEHYVNELRKDTVYFSLASTLDNIHTLGLNPIKNFKRMLTDLQFQTSILNEEILGIENGFYSSLDEHIHGYDMEDYAHIDNLELVRNRGDAVRDCRWDADTQRLEPLHIALDYNAAINSIVTGQEFEDEYRFLSSMYVERPQYLKHLIEKWCDYYHYHGCKEVVYYYDNTAVGDNAKGDIKIYEEVVRALTRRGWNVHQHYAGQASTHHSRYLLWSQALDDSNTRVKRFRFNRTNCKAWYVSASQAGIKKSGDLFKKDKSSERPDSDVPPPEATHLSEAGDTLLYSRLRGELDKVPEFLDNVISG